MTDEETHRGCAGTRGEGRRGRASTHTGRGRSHTRCLMEGRWQLQQRKSGEEGKGVSDKDTYAAAPQNAI